MPEDPEASDDIGAYGDDRQLHFCFVLCLLLMEGAFLLVCKGLPKTKFAMKPCILFNSTPYPPGLFLALYSFEEVQHENSDN
ncbi:MAG: hypothetical protein H0W50_08410 [Parachlamydiaceae bacterium]|nr:hypothetical protein [Parachlamydiaceae bacterium]